MVSKILSKTALAYFDLKLKSNEVLVYVMKKLGAIYGCVGCHLLRLFELLLRRAPFDGCGGGSRLPMES